MKFLLKLVWRDFIRHRSMLAFALLAIIATCCLIVWFVASIDMNAFAADNGKKDYYGVYSLALCSDKGLDLDLTGRISALPGISRTGFARQAFPDMLLLGFDGALVPSGMGARRSPAITGMTDTAAPFEIEDGRWFQADGECVVGTAAEQILTAVPGQKESGRRIAVGDKIRVTTDAGVSRELTVVGTFEQKARKDIRQQKGNQTFNFGFGVGLGGKSMGGAKPAPAAQKPGANAPAGGPGGPGMMRGGPGGPGMMRGGPGGPGGMMRGGPFGRVTTPSPENASIYVPAETALSLSDKPGNANIMFIQLEEPDKIDDFLKAVENLLGQPLAKSGLRMTDTRPPKEDMQSLLASGQASSKVISQAWSTIGIVILASVFIIFTTLSMSVSEKTRYLAMLRTIGFTKTQVAAFILLEGFFLGILGWLGGIVSGWLLLTVMLALESGVVPVVSLSPSALAFAFCCSTAGALAASLLPAWRATRVSAAESMPNRIQRFSNRKLLAFGAAGIVLLALIPVLVFGIPAPIPVRLAIFTTVGTLFLGAGFLMVVPWAAVFTERIPGAIIARLFGFNRRFLAQVLTGNQWRTITTTVALAIGLGLFTSIYIWSFSMLNMFTVPRTIPDMLVRFQEGAVGPYTTENAAKMPGIRKNHFMPVTVAQPDVDDELSKKLMSRGAMAANLVAMGIDPDSAWRDDDPLIRLKFVKGSPEKARKAFENPAARVCVIPETLAVNGKLALGDTIRLKMTADGKRAREQRRGMPGMAQDDEYGDDAPPAQYAAYTVVGIVDFAWVWMSKCAGVRVSAGRTSGLVFTPRAALVRDFGAIDNEFFWFDTDPGVKHADVEAYMKTIAAEGARRARKGNPLMRLLRSFSGGTRWDSGINKNYVMVSSNESLNNSLNSRAYSVIDAMTQMPLIILVLASIAIVNTMVVSVRSRRWEMGVLRACGVTRSGLVRIILAEAILIGICACVVSFAFGFYYSWLTTKLMDLAPMFGIIAPPMTIPWDRLLPGYAIALALSIIAGIYPAMATGFKDTATLLQRKD